MLVYSTHWLEEKTASLARDLYSADAAVQNAARQYIRDQFETIVVPLLESYDDDCADRSIGPDGIGWFPCLLSFMLVLLGGLGMVTSLMLLSLWPLLPFCAVYGAAVVCAVCQSNSRPRHEIKRQNIRRRAQARVTVLEEALGTIADRRHLDLLMGLCGEDSALLTTEHPLICALVRLLPQATKEDSFLFNRRHRKMVLAYMSEVTLPDREKSTIALIETVARLGDGGYRTPVRKLADAFPMSQRGMNIRETARRCLAKMEARLDRERCAVTLLRSSDAPRDGGAALLRPAHSDEEEPPQLLLRPVDARSGD